MQLEDHLRFSEYSMCGGSVASCADYFGVAHNPNTSRDPDSPYQKLSFLVNLLKPLTGTNQTARKSCNAFSYSPEDIALARKYLHFHIQNIFELPEKDQASALNMVLQCSRTIQDNMLCIPGTQSSGAFLRGICVDGKHMEHITFNNQQALEQGLRNFPANEMMPNLGAVEGAKDGYLQSAAYHVVEEAIEKIENDKNRAAFWGQLMELVAIVGSLEGRYNKRPDYEASCLKLDKYEINVPYEESTNTNETKFFRSQDLTKAINNLVEYRLNGCYDDDPKRVQHMVQVGQMLELKRTNAVDNKAFTMDLLTAMQQAYNYAHEYQPAHDVAGPASLTNIVNIYHDLQHMPLVEGKLNNFILHEETTQRLIPVVEELRGLPEEQQNQAIDGIIDTMIFSCKGVKVNIVPPNVAVKAGQSRQ